ncbi:MAG: uroporphyrinogen-III synthase, partial [Simplicispira sp.]|nr:uroporphyrinogen-III synthase [Simplicispira sp.]
MATPLTLVTRPAREAAQWVAALQQRGIDAQALPLIDIGPPPDAQALNTARQHVTDYRAIMLVSGNAAQHFFDPKTALTLADKALPAIKTRVWSPGPGTAQTLQALGVPAARIDRPAHDAVQFDSEAL